jgi:hypothetical protein
MPRAMPELRCSNAVVRLPTIWGTGRPEVHRDLVLVGTLDAAAAMLLCRSCIDEDDARATTMKAKAGRRYQLMSGEVADLTRISWSRQPSSYEAGGFPVATRTSLRGDSGATPASRR